MITVSMHSTSCCAVALALVGAVVQGCDFGKTCTQMGCTSGAGIRIDLPSSAATLTGQTVTVCRNAECYAAVIPPPGEAGTGKPLSFPGAAAVNGTLQNDADQTSQLYVTWQLPWNSPAPQSADRYVVTLTNSAGTTTTLFDKTTTSYEKLSPNGDDCGPICWQAIFPP